MENFHFSIKLWKVAGFLVYDLVSYLTFRLIKFLLNTIYNSNENKWFKCLKEVQTAKPYKKGILVYLTSAVCKWLLVLSILILTISPLAFPRFKLFWKKKISTVEYFEEINCGKSLFSQIVVSFKWKSFRRTYFNSLDIL